MWIAERMAIKPRDDENAAMAYQRFGRFENRDDAHYALVEAVEAEIAGWVRMNMDPSREREVLDELVITGADKVERGNVRWQVREF